MRDSVKIMSNWLESFKDTCTEEQLKEICYRIIQYGIYETWIEKEDDDAVVKVAMNLISPQIDIMQDEYEEKIERGKRGGRPAKLNPRIVWKLAREGKKAKEISEELGGVPLTTIYSSEGWKQRHLSDFYEKD